MPIRRASSFSEVPPIRQLDVPGDDAGSELFPFRKVGGFLRVAEAGPSRQLLRLFDNRPTSEDPDVGACRGERDKAEA